jgi:8-oxo-dGTP diphosphatase
VSLNPSLEDVRYCPRCGAEATIAYPRSITCASCGYAAFYNPKPVACAIPADDANRVILLRRGFDPGKDLWTFPGGFVDLGESVEQAAHREVDEELGISIELHGLVGVYSRAQERVVLVVYGARALGAPRRTPEAIDVRAFEPTEIPWDELAFWSTGLALRDFLASHGVAVAAESPATPGS